MNWEESVDADYESRRLGRTAGAIPSVLPSPRDPSEPCASRNPLQLMAVRQAGTRHARNVAGRPCAVPGRDLLHAQISVAPSLYLT